MNDFLLRAIDRALQRGADYADVRIVHTVTQHLVLTNGTVDTIALDESLGIGVRVLSGGGWGFASSRELTAIEIDRVTDMACQIAAASALVQADVPTSLGPAVKSQGSYTTPIMIDPFNISLEDKLSLLAAADQGLARVPGLVVRRSSLVAIKETKHFANTDGAFTTQTLYEVGGGIVAIAAGDNEVQTRSYPNSTGGLHVAAGWEAVLRWDLPGNAERIANEAVQLLSAAPCPRGLATTLILGSAQLAMQIHESCGHAVELDRVFGTEAAYAGTSFLSTDKLHHFRYGSDWVNLTADATQPEGLGTAGWDDEGIPAQRIPLVESGRFVGYLMSRETAARLDLPSNGCMRASGWNRIPLIRMPNVHLEPGDWTLDALIADTDDGIYMEQNRSWSIDEQRYNFQFGTEMSYEIKRGKLGRMLRNGSYSGLTPEFWRSCDAVCNRDHWQVWSVVRCGKGQPSQTVRTGHGAAPARFRNVQLGPR